MVIGETAGIGSFNAARPQVETPDSVNLQQTERQVQAQALQAEQAQNGSDRQEQSFSGSSTADANRDGRALQIDLSV